jgi:hypothetical protein
LRAVVTALTITTIGRLSAAAFAGVSVINESEKKMKPHKPNLSNKDHKAMDDFIGRVLDAYKDGVITKKSAVAGIAQVMAALDIQNTSEAVS